MPQDHSKTLYCATPTCDTETPERFCVDCKANLERIRVEFEAESKRRFTPSIGKGGKRVRPKRGPTCCLPGCFETRVPPSPYCITHESEGRGDD